MMSPPEGPAGTALRDALGAESPLLPFALAVARHLAGPTPAGAPDELAARILAALPPTPGDEMARATRLLADPALLASFFQNADLLAADDPESAETAQAVMHALALAWETEE